MTTAIVIVSSAHLMPDAGRGITYGLALGYSIVSIVKDDWKQAFQMIADGEANVLIVADPHHLDVTRDPRVEIATSRSADGDPRRPRIIE